MKAPISTARIALRQTCHALLRRQPLAVHHPYHAYTLPTTRPTPQTRPSAVPEDTLPRVHETRRPPPPPQQQQQPIAHPSPAEQSRTAAPRPRPRLRARKAAMNLTPSAVEKLRTMLDGPEPKLIKVGVRNRGCSGLAYHLEYVDNPASFDEVVEQDGVKVLIDSKALFSIIGSEMDWVEDKLKQGFVFRNPNIKEQCGCGESFMV